MPCCTEGEPDDGGDETGISDDKAVVGAAFDILGDPDAELRGKGAMRPPLNDNLDDVLPLALDPGRRGEDILGEFTRAVTLVGDGGATVGNLVEGDGVRLRRGGVAGIVSNGLSVGA